MCYKVLAFRLWTLGKSLLNMPNNLVISRVVFLNCDALCDLVPFVQLKKREKHSWRSFTFSKVAD